MVGEVGVEPTANWLRANCSTTELLTREELEDCISEVEFVKLRPSLTP